MRLLFDTSSLVAAFVPAHPAHQPSWTWLEETLAGSHQGLVATHTLAELYAVLTRLPLRPLIPPSVALQLIEENLRTFQVVALSATDYRAVLRRLEKHNLTGGSVYGALIAQAALKGKAEGLVTLNPSHFRRLGSDIEGKVRAPTEAT
jgi:predicted nucleic acid-binding protein